MGTISSSIGIVSGINYGELISALIAVDKEPETIVQDQITESQDQEQAYNSFSNSITSLQAITNSLSLPQTFAAATATSSNSSALTATAAEGAAVGSYQFQVAQLVSTQQLVTNGFANTTSAPVGAGTLTIEEGGGEAFSQTPLSQLNGGQGVQRGQFRITDGSGASAVIDTSDAVNLDDVINDINSAPNISVKASLSDQGIVLTDTSGQTKNQLTVTDLGGGSAAASLGIAGQAPAYSDTITGSAINYVGAGTSLATLNDGLGVGTAATGADFQINVASGTSFAVTVGTAQTVGDVLNEINTDSGGAVTASLGTNGQSIQLQDNTTGTAAFSVTELNGSTAAANLGILGTGSGGTISGTPILAGLDSVLISSLKGGSGIDLGQITITDRKGNTGTIDLAGASSLSDVLNDINNNDLGIKVNASINNAGTGIQLTDTSGGTGNLTIANADSTDTATALGIAGTFTTSTAAVVGTNLQRQYISDNTQLSTLNGGNGVDVGTFTIENSAGTISQINLVTGSGTLTNTVTTIGGVINAINSQASGVKATLNANGNGILLTDTAGGSGKLTVENSNDTTASDLNIAGTATGTTIDGGFQKTITVTSSDTLSTLQAKINDLGFGLTAQIVNDGSATNPYRLTLTSVNSGQAGRVLVDGGTTNLNPTTLVQGQDAAVFYGGNGEGSQPLLITSSTNQLTNVVKGVTISLQGASSQPVTLNVATDPSGVSTDLQNFVTQYNALVTQIGTYTQFNTTTNQGGLLFGDATTEQVQSTLYNIINSTFNGTGQFTNLAQLGITFGANSQLNFDPNQFASAFAADPTAVQNLFSQTQSGPNNTTIQNGIGYTISNALNSLTDPVNGLLTLQDNSLNSQIQTNQTYFNDLDAQVQQKQALLETQFASLEETLAGFQSQQQVLTAFAGTNSSSTSSSSSSSASSVT